ncbi:hypothetical protein ABIA35_003774 [Catenulispora sp. MAP12-49]|uniref:hypothetical protein n=1 Tax=Catenulispora sp. MAP12-49 TaxID=3156302 RepID=UPI0035136A07
MANETVTDKSPDPLEAGSGVGRVPGESVETPAADQGTPPGPLNPLNPPDSLDPLDPLNPHAPRGGDPIEAALTPVAPPEPADAPRRNPVVRAVAAVGRTFVRDMVVFFSVPVREVRTKKLMAIPATLLCVLTIGVLWILEMNRPGGLAFVIDIAGVRQGEPIWQLLPQLPLSLFAPAPDLPAWGAMAQVLIAFGIAECWLGWKKMIAIAMITSAVTSMAARLMVYASNWLHIGTPQIDNFQVDTGPSVAVVALLIYLALRLRTYWVVALTAVSMGGEAAILPNLAGREHLVAISLGIVTYFLLDRWWPAWRRWRIERATAD